MAFRALSQRLGPAAARCLATETKAAAAAAVAEPTLPLKLHGLPGRYASALYVAAAKAKALPEVEKELAAVIDMAAGNDKFADFLADPSASKSVKTKGIGSIMEAGKFSATTKQFFGAAAALLRTRSGARRARAGRPASAHHPAPLQPCWLRTGGWVRRTSLRSASRSS